MNIELFLEKKRKSYERLKIGDLSQSFFIRVSLCPSCLVGHMMYAIPGFIETTQTLKLIIVAAEHIQNKQNKIGW